MVKSERRWRVGAAVAAVLVGAMLAGNAQRAAAAGSVALSLDPVAQTVASGSSFSVAIWADTGAQPVDAIEVHVRIPVSQFDVVDADSTKPGIQITPGTAFPTLLANTFNTTSGEIEFAAGIALGAGPISGKLLVATMPLRAKIPGVASITFASGNSAAAGGEAVPVTTSAGSAVTVTDGGAPAPATPTGTPAPAPPTAIPVPTATPAPATPTATPGPPVSVTTAAGGTLTQAGVKLTFPAGVLAASATLLVTVGPQAAPANLPDGSAAGSAAFQIGWTGGQGDAVAQLDREADLEVTPTAEDLRLASGDLGRLRLARFDPATNAWVDLAGDPAGGAVHGRTLRAGLFALRVELATPSGLAAPVAALATGASAPLGWTVPQNVTQVHLQVIPAQRDGPGVNLIFGDGPQVTGGQFTLEAPVLGSGPYVVLPGMSYTWRVRTSTVATGLGENDKGWSRWVEGSFRTAPPATSGLGPSAPLTGATVTGLTPNLAWQNAEPGVFYYEVQVSQAADFGDNAFLYYELRHGGVTTPPNSYTVPAAFPLQGASTYYWRVRPRVQGDGTPVPWPPAWQFKTQ